MQPETNRDLRIGDRRRLATWLEVDFILSSRKSAPTPELILIRGATKGWELAARLDTQLPNPTRVLLEQHAEELLHVVAHDIHFQPSMPHESLHSSPAVRSLTTGHQKVRIERGVGM